jgi:ketosteroid isomerase-like protein
MIATIQEPVTGHEKIPESASPLAALSQFYRALNGRDMALMEQNWHGGDDAAMDNPLGGIKRGWAEIRAVYERLFAVGDRYHFEFHDYTLQRYGEVFIAIGRERGTLLTQEGKQIPLAIRTTRIFRWTGDRWRQLHHHGSIEDPNMLASYQQAVLKSAA